MSLVAGLDEAGRGPAIGPMVLACVVMREDRLPALEGRIRDSKLMSPAGRRRALTLIKSLAEEIKVRVVEPWEIDLAVSGVSDKNLNFMEARLVSEIIASLSCRVRRVFVDSPDPKPDRFAALVESMLGRDDVEVVASNKAEAVYPVVAAASIVAKVTRDRIVEDLKRRYGDFGSGYPSDPRTRSFLQSCLARGELPPIVRRSWSTLGRLGASS